MTKQESFKRRVRARMEKTGERYAAARQALLQQAEARRSRIWVSEPDLTDDAVRSATGRGWDEWCDLIESWPGHHDGHTAIARHLEDVVGVDPWWAQGITVGFERITGRRLPHQQQDGTFTASRSRTVTLDHQMLNLLLRDPKGRAALFPAHATELRSKPSSKAARIGIGPGVAVISVEPQGDSRAKVTIAHERLPEFADVDEWRFYWSEWLDAIGETLP